MTSLSLSLWIALAITLQLTLGLGVVYWRHWRGYQTLRRRADGLPVAQDGRPAPAPDAVGTWAGWRTFKVERRVLEDETQSVCSFYLVPQDGKALPSFLPGQFLTFRLDLPASHGGSEQITRCYSLSDAPGANAYRVSIKRVPAPAGCDFPPARSSNYFHDQVKVGSRLQVRAPSGHFHIERSAVPVVLVGSGVGITPMLSMVNWCLAQQPGREVWLFYGVRHAGELVMKPQLEALAAAHPNFHLRFCFSAAQADEEVGGKDHQRGRITIDLLRLQLPIEHFHFYLCGPSAMLESLVPGLEDWGVDESRIHFESFGPASIKRRGAATAQESASPGKASDLVVSFAFSGKQLAWPSSANNLLEFAEASGIAVASGCRAGGCGSCQTTIVSGAVSYRQPPDYDPEPGTCLPCVCTPKTSLTLEA